MANDIYSTVAKCMLCTRNSRTNRKEMKWRLILRWVPRNFVGIVILVHLLNTESGYLYIAVRADRYSSLTEAIRSAKKMAERIANNFMEH